ncbi:MAG: DUF177 domain-containing protein [Gemmatimonadales bacterium]
MLLVDLRQLREGPVETSGSLPVGDEAFRGLEFELADPVEVEGRLQVTGDGEYYWHATIRGRVRGECRRCLADVFVPVDTEIRVLFSHNPDSDDPGIYPLAGRATQVDLGEAVREELALAVPNFLLCREGCAGLCPQCGTNLNAGPCACSGPAVTV